MQSTKKKIDGNRYEPKVALENNVYPKMYYNHEPKSVAVDETPTKNKTPELQIVGWMLIEDQQLMKFNLRTDGEPEMMKINA